jgi:hypothetical protein
MVENPGGEVVQSFEKSLGESMLFGQSLKGKALMQFY